MEQGTAARGFDHAAEVPVVPVIGRVLYAQVIATQRREPFNPATKMSKNLFYILGFESRMSTHINTVGNKTLKSKKVNISNFSRVPTF